MYKKQTLPFPISRRLLVLDESKSCYRTFSGNIHEMQLLHILRQFKSIEYALADEAQLIPVLCCYSNFLLTCCYRDKTAFCGSMYVN